MQRTGFNRHRRGYATKEAGSAVHFLVLGPIGLARSQFLNLPNFIIIDHHILYFSSFKILFYYYRYYSTKHSIRFLHQLVIREHQGMKITILPHATRYQAIPMNLKHNYMY